MSLDGYYGIVDDRNRIVNVNWYSWMSDYEDGLVRVYIHDSYNYMNLEGKLLSINWFDMAYPFHNGRGIVVRNWKYNMINKEGELVYPDWYDSISEMPAVIQSTRNDYFFIKQYFGKFLSSRGLGL